MSTFDVTKVKTVDISKVRPNTWNPKQKNTREFRKIVLSIEKDGQKLPVLVRYNPKDDTEYEIVDGEQRYTALKELKSDEVIIYDLGEVSDIDAKNETLWTQLQVPFDNIMLAPIVAELNMNGLMLPFEDDMVQELIEIEKFELDEMLKEQKKDADADDGFELRTFTAKMTPEQLEILTEAMDKVKDENDNVSDGRALELIAADFLAGA